MSRRLGLRCVPVWWAVIGLCTPEMAWAAAAPTPEPGPLPTPITDVALAPGGVLVGQVVDSKGSPVQRIPVTVLRENTPITTAESGRDGRFTVRGLQQGGVYQVAAAEAQGTYRVWAPGTAPPAAQPQATVVTQGALPSRPYSPLKFWLASPWVAIGIIGAAIAIPIAVNAANDDDPASP